VALGALKLPVPAHVGAGAAQPLLKEGLGGRGVPLQGLRHSRSSSSAEAERHSMLVARSKSQRGSKSKEEGSCKLAQY